MLMDLDARSRSALGDAANEPRGLENAVRRMEECGRIPRQRLVEILAPLGGEARVA
jgi:hypothetical protein